MRVSEYFKLGRTQPTLSFVDVHVFNDTRLFVSPRAVKLLNTEWGDECVSLVQDFFGEVLSAIRSDEHEVAIGLLERLKEPNETHLGLSQGKSKGRALGTGSAREVWKSLSESEAAKSGLLTDLEDTVLMIDGISVDVVSDIMTNIIRGPLIAYTQEACDLYDIPLTQGVASGPMWNPHVKEWTEQYVDLPLVDGEKLLLVPKDIVRLDMDYDVDRYYRHFILEEFKQKEISSNSDLVRIIKSGKNKGNLQVYIKDLKEKYGTGKSAVVRHTLDNPHFLQRYKSQMEEPSPPLTHRAIADVEGTERPDWDTLLSAVTNLPVGANDAYSYEDRVEALLSALFYPALSNPKAQHSIHEGRKRIDISYSNTADTGFFRWLSQHYSSANIFFEFKNYGRELDNPALDQIAGRFSPSRGQVGIIVCRELADPERFAKRCRDTANDHRGYIMALQDSDLEALVKSVKSDLNFLELKLLRDKFDYIIS